MKTPWIAKLLIFFLLFMGTSLLSSIAMIPVKDDHLRMMFSQLGMWLAPALLYMYVMYRDATFARMRLQVFGWTDVLYFLVGFALLLPASDVLHQLNSSIRFPEAWSSVEIFFQKMQAQGEASFAQVLAPIGEGKLFTILFLLAVLPAVCEEFFFRGVILSEMLSGRVNKHVAVWMVAFIFSAIHLDFYGLFPRWMMGAVFGYAFVYTRSLWTPIVLHFLNNASIVVFYYAYDRGLTPINPLTDTRVVPLWVALVCGSLALVLFCYFIFSRSRARSSSE